MDKDPLTEKVIGCAIEVHRTLGPGLLENVYQQALAYELSQAGLSFTLEVQLSVDYKEIHLDCGYRLDLVVENSLIVELKSVDGLAGIHSAQLLTYLKLSNLKTGLLINFNVERLVDGIKRISN
jgi:GxxExxY protein